MQLVLRAAERHMKKPSLFMERSVGRCPRDRYESPFETGDEHERPLEAFRPMEGREIDTRAVCILPARRCVEPTPKTTHPTPAPHPHTQTNARRGAHAAV